MFVSERKAPLTADAIRKRVERAGRHADIEFSIHPHMLHHATGYKRANDGQDMQAIQHDLGHRDLQAPPALHRSGVRPLQEFLARLTID